MSFDLFLFERREEIKTSFDVLNYFDEFMDYGEDRDYNSLEGCSPVIKAFAKKLFEKFPPINMGTLPEHEPSAEEEVYYTDYSFGERAVYCSFSFRIGKEALYEISIMMDEMGMGLYDPQGEETYMGEGIDVLLYRTESTDVAICDWETAKEKIKHLSGDEFIILWYRKDGGYVDDYIQMRPYYKKRGFLEKLFGAKEGLEIQGYGFEIAIDRVLYQTEVSTKEELLSLTKDWCLRRKTPDVSSYQVILDWRDKEL